MKSAVLLLCLALSAGCSTTNRGSFKPLVAESREETWAALQKQRADFDGFDSLVEVRASGAGRSQNFRARVVVDRQRKVQITGLGPLGVDLFTLFLTGEQLLFLNHLNSTYWEGSADRFLSGLGPIGVLRSEELAPLLLGVPADEARCDSAGLCRGDRFSYEIEPSGLRKVNGPDLEIVYDSPSYPATNLRMTSKGAGTISVKHLETYPSPKVLRTPRVPSAYRCCELPDGTQQ